MKKNKLNLDLRKMLATALDVVYYPAWWNPLYGKPKYAHELNVLELAFLGIRRQEIKPSPRRAPGLRAGFVGMGAGAGAAAYHAGDEPADPFTDNVSPFIDPIDLAPEVDLRDPRCPLSPASVID